MRHTNCFSCSCCIPPLTRAPEFIRVPGRHPHSPHVVAKGLSGGYDAAELGTTPLGAQLMGNNPELLTASRSGKGSLEQWQRRLLKGVELLFRSIPVTSIWFLNFLQLAKQVMVRFV